MESSQELTINEPVVSREVISIRVDALTYESAVRRIVAWARHRESRYVCVANVHMVMEAADDPEFRAVVNAADLVTSDGMPLVWMLRLMGVRGAKRVYGPELMEALCLAASQNEIPVSLIGGTDDVLAALQTKLRASYPELRIAFAWSPPFGLDLGAETDRRLRDLSRTWPGIVFVALGCPKQERWMQRHTAAIAAPMVGVGAAFDFLAGSKKRAPAVLGKLGLEWGFRLVTEPRRLLWRYAYHNPRFLLRASVQLARGRGWP